jgi:hypothetical protein
MTHPELRSACCGAQKSLKKFWTVITTPTWTPLGIMGYLSFLGTMLEDDCSLFTCTWDSNLRWFFYFFVIMIALFNWAGITKVIVDYQNKNEAL